MYSIHLFISNLNCQRIQKTLYSCICMFLFHCKMSDLRMSNIYLDNFMETLENDKAIYVESGNTNILWSHIVGARWTSGSVFAYGSRGPWFESYTGLILLWAQKNKSLRLHSTKVWIGTLRGQCMCKFDIPGRRMLVEHKTGSEVVSPGRR